MIFCFPRFIYSKSNSIENKENSEFISNNLEENSTEDENIVENSTEENPKYDWALKIPKINLYAEISSGTDNEILDKYIGHFENSKKESGNVCLAAHNRGYNENYFENLKELKNGDEIFYYINNSEYKYIVDEIIVIYETDWTVIENTEEDRITLITCIENRPSYRLCVRGIRKE